MNIENLRTEIGCYVFENGGNTDYLTLRGVLLKIMIKHFGKMPYVYFLSTDMMPVPIENKYWGPEQAREMYEAIDKVDRLKTIQKIVEKFPDTIRICMTGTNPEYDLYFNEEQGFAYFKGEIFIKSLQIPQELMDCIVTYEKTHQIKCILRNNRGAMNTTPLTINPIGVLEGNYNDDFFPIHDKITKTIHEDRSSIIILHGKPGTGKTSYIRHLIASNPDIEFFWVDSSVFKYIDNTEFVDFILQCKNSVFILEDSEALLMSREETKNTALQSLLNITDGLLGDSLKLKFICTFNTGLENIDEALLRKGRMKVKYEFKELQKEKVAEIFKKLDVDETLAKDMPLCDIYNYLEDNGNEDTNKNKQAKLIGF